MRDPGEYDKLMTLMQPGLGPASASGEQLETGAQAAEMWGKLQPLQGRERKNADAADAQRSVTILTPYRSDITIDSTNWLVYGSRRFDIESVVNVDEANEEFEIAAVEHLS